MKDRIKMIMEAERMTPARFADSLQIGRAVISHVLNGRNNPSLDVITRILSQMPQVNSDWLLTGNGSMYKSESVHTTASSQAKSMPASVHGYLQSDLFSQSSINAPDDTDTDKNRQENIVHSSNTDIESVIKERIIYKERAEKKINKIIIYYSDNTFETFEPGK